MGERVDTRCMTKTDIALIETQLDRFAPLWRYGSLDADLVFVCREDASVSVVDQAASGVLRVDGVDWFSAAWQ